jgi:hypothetical protein
MEGAPRPQSGDPASACGESEIAESLTRIAGAERPPSGLLARSFEIILILRAFAGGAIGAPFAGESPRDFLLGFTGVG